MDVLTLNDLIKRKKKETKKKGSPIFPDVKGSVEMFNHVSDTAGPIPGTGISMGEEYSLNDLINNRDIFDDVVNTYSTQSSPSKGPAYILPDGRFLYLERAHGEVDEYVADKYGVDLADYPNSYLVDKFDCVRLNDGNKSFYWDTYITLPKNITSSQIYSIEEWLENYDRNKISVGSVLNSNFIEYHTDDISRIVNRIKYYKTNKVLKESNEDFLTEEDERQRYIDNGLDPDIDRTPGPRDDGTYYDERGFHWRPNPSGGNDILIPEVTTSGSVCVPAEWAEWWT